MIKAIRIDDRQLQITAATTASDINTFTADTHNVALIDETGRAAWYTDHADGTKILATFKPDGVYQAGNLKITVLRRSRCYVTTAEYGLSKAARPFNSRLDKAKLAEAGFAPLPDWKDAVRRYIEEARL